MKKLTSIISLKYVIAVILFFCSIDLLAWSKTPTYESGVWYSYVYNSTSDLSQYSKNSYFLNATDIFPPNATSDESNKNITFQYKTNGEAKIKIYYLDVNGNQKATDETGTMEGKNWTDCWFSTTLTDIFQIKIQKTNTSITTRPCKLNKIYIKLAYHVRFGTNNSSIGDKELENDFGTTPVESTDKTYTINLRSFYVTSGLKMKVVTDDGNSTNIGNIFKIVYGGTTSTGEVTVASEKVCGYRGANESSNGNPANTANHSVTIRYCPDEAVKRKAKLVFYDGTYNGSNALATVYLSGTGELLQSSITTTTSTIQVNADVPTTTLSVGNQSSSSHIMCSHYDANNSKKMNGNTLTITGSSQCWSVKSRTASSVTLNINGAEENDDDYAKVSVSVGYDGSAVLTSCSAQTVNLQINKLGASDITWTQPTGDVFDKKETTPLSAGNGITYGETVYSSSSSTNVDIKNNQATFNEAGFYDLTVNLMKNKTYKNCSSVKHVKVNLGGFKDTEYGSLSEPQSVTIADNRYTSGKVNVSVTGDFKVSSSASGPWEDAIAVTLSSSPVTFYVCFAPITIPTSGQSMYKTGTLTVDDLGSFNLSGTMTWEEMNFPKTYIGQASTEQSTDFSGICNVDVPNGYMVSVDGTTWKHSLTGETVSSKLYVKYQPNDAADGEFVTITYDGGTKVRKIKVTGTKENHTLSFVGTYKGLARDLAWDLTNFTATSATAAIGTDPDYYVSFAGGAEPTNWGKSQSVSTQPSKLYVKFQPSDSEGLTGDVVVTADGRNYTVNVTGTIQNHEGTINPVLVGCSSHYGFKMPKNDGTTDNIEDSWYYFKNGRGGATSGQFCKLDATFYVENLSATNPAVISIVKNESDLDFALNTGSDIGYTYNIKTFTDIVRIAYSPRERTQSTSCKVRISANGKTYTYTVASKANEQEASFGEVEIGKSIEHKPCSLALFRPSYGTGAGFEVQAPANFLVSTDATTWTTSITFLNSTSYYDKLYVKFVPETVGSCNTSMYIVDKGASNRGSYKINLKGTGTESKVKLSNVADGTSQPGSFTMQNYTPSAQGVRVVGADNFKVSDSQNGSFDNAVTIYGENCTFWVRQEDISTPGTTSSTVTMQDLATERTYRVTIEATVEKIQGEISVPETLTYYSNDKSAHLVVGEGNEVYGNKTNMTNDIILDVDDADKTYIQIVDDKKIQIQQGITADTYVNVTAKMKSTSKYKADEKTFVVYIKYVNVTEESSLKWKKDNNNRWQILTKSVSTSDAGSKEDNVEIYIPKNTTTSGTFDYTFTACKKGVLNPGYPKIDMYVKYSPDYSDNLVSSIGQLSSSDVTSTCPISTFPDCSIVKVGWTETVYRSGLIDYQHEKNKGYTLTIPVPEHYNDNNIDTKTVQFENTEIGQVSAIYSIALTDLFTSFLTTEDLTIVADGNNPTGVFTRPESGILVPANNVMSPYTPLSSYGTGLYKDGDSYYLRFQFNPKEVKSDYEGKFYLKDGQNIKYTITLKGICYARTQTVTWAQGQTQTAQYASGDVNLSATSNLVAISGETYKGGALNVGDALPITYKLVDSEGNVKNKIDNVAEIINNSTSTTLRLLGVGSFKVRALQEGTNFTDEAHADITFTITPGSRTIVWSNKEQSVTSASSTIDLDACSKNQGGTKIQEGTTTYTLVSADDISGTSLKCVELDNVNNKLKVNGSGNAVVRVSFAGTANYENKEEDWNLTVSDEALTIAVTPPAAGEITSTTEDFDLWGCFENSNYKDKDETIVKTVPNSTSSEFTISDNQHLTAYKEKTSVQIPCTVTVTSRYLANGSHPQAIGSITLSISKGTLLFNVAAGSWTDNTKWSRSDIVTSHTDGDLSDYNVQIEKTCNIPSTCVAKAHAVVNNTAGNLVLKADENNSATLIFEEGSPRATVEIYLRGHKNNDGIADNPDWQYRGFIGDYQSGLSSNVKVYKWDESLASGDQSCWVDSTSTKHGAWTGYSMANMTDAAATYTYQTVLLPTTGGQTYNLSYHQYNGDKNSRNNNGVNIVTNSYSAPIKVSELTFSGMHSYVYFFKTQKHDSWTKRKDVFVTCPSQTCSAVLENDLIPAGQAFLVQATHDGSTDGSSSSITVNASSIIGQASGRFYAPEEERRFNILEIKVKGNSAEDEVYLLESDECNRKYDNGYDGLKMFSTGIPQIYANNSFGGTSINADSSMLGQYIGFRAAADVTEYEITFDIDRLEGYDELYLFDHLTKRYADILAGSTYRFTATEADDPERFQIMGRRNDGTYFTGADQWIEVVARRALLHGFDDLEETVRITDLMGNLLWTDNSKNGPWFDIPEVPAGVYIIHCGKATAKFIVK